MMSSRLSLVGLSIALIGCSEATGPTDPTAAAEIVFDPPAFSVAVPFEEGSCPNGVFTRMSETLDNGAIVTWTSSFGAFDYTLATDHEFTVEWSVEGGSAEFDSFDERIQKMRNLTTFTPKQDVVGSWTEVAGLDADSRLVTVNLSEMHPAGDYMIGNAHFHLGLTVTDDLTDTPVIAKFGVNDHLEDLDEAAGAVSNCEVLP